MDVYKLIEVSILDGNVAVVFADNMATVLTGQEIRTFAESLGKLILPPMDDPE